MSTRLTVFVMCIFIGMTMLAGSGVLAHWKYHAKPQQYQSESDAYGIVYDLLRRHRVSMTVDSAESVYLQSQIAELATRSSKVSYEVFNYLFYIMIISVFGACLCMTSLLMRGEMLIRKKLRSKSDETETLSSD